MKRLALLCLVIMSVVSCSDFQHIHYRKVRKIPASGNVIPLSIDQPEKKTNAIINIETIVVAKKSKIGESIISNQKISKQLVIEKKINSNQIENKPAKGHIENNSTKQSVKTKIKKRDGSALLIFFFLFLGVVLISWGIGLILTGIFAAVWWFIPAGAILVFLGLMPFLGMISFAFGNKTKRKPKKYEEK
ncbi:hypothetical protein BH09BAC5_BH09BAC5_25880 [soil metagenome]